jgi:hypothetical protein
LTPATLAMRKPISASIEVGPMYLTHATTPPHARAGVRRLLACENTCVVFVGPPFARRQLLVTEPPHKKQYYYDDEA